MLDIQDLTIRFGGITALQDVALHVDAGTVVGLIGPNGAGKTTQFNCVSRRYRPDAGSMRFEGTDLGAVAPYVPARLGIARTFQNLGLFARMSVRDNVLVGTHHGGRAGFVSASLRLPAVRREERAAGERADALLDRLGLTGVADRPAAGLPFGTLKRVELARALAVRPRLLLLDEPVNGLSHGEVGEFAALLRELRAEFALTMIVVEHHMGFVMNTCDRVVCLEFGRVIAAGTPDEVRGNPAVVRAYLGTAA
ncbi:ABC transporter ATP-binding protein [Nocardia thailandica]